MISSARPSSRGLGFPKADLRAASAIKRKARSTRRCGDISTATFTAELDVSTSATDPAGLYFKDDGTILYVSSTDTRRVFEYTI